MSVDIQTFPEVRVASVRNIGCYSTIGGSFEKLGIWGGPKGIFTAQALTLGVYWDDPREVPIEQLRADACVTVGEDVEPDPEAGVEIQTLPGGEYAMFLRYLYDMSEFPILWEAVIMTDFPKIGRQFGSGRPCLEMYYSCCDSHPLKKTVVDICVPIV